MNLAQKITIAVTLLAVAVFLIGGAWGIWLYIENDGVKAVVGTAGILALGGSVFLFLGIRRKRPKE